MPKLIDQVARRFTIAVLLIALGAGTVLVGQGSCASVAVVTAVLIVACPCALGLEHALRLWAHHPPAWVRRGLFLRDAEVVERMAHVDTVVFDKTGTLTAREAYEVEWNGRCLGREEKAWYVRSRATARTPLSAVLYNELKGDLCYRRSKWRIMLDTAWSVWSNGVAVRLGSAEFCGGD